MARYIIQGGKALSGQTRVQGAKNSALALMAASLLSDSSAVTLRNCPRLTDVEATKEILQRLGCDVMREDDIIDISARHACGTEVPDSLMRRLRSSTLFLGAMLAKNGCARLSYPGGCELGPRPIDLHISAFKKMGVTILEEYGYLNCKAENGLHGADIVLSFPSVGATENIMIAAAKAKGVTTITNAAREPEICDLAELLNLMGGRINGAGSSIITIEGIPALHGAAMDCMPDRIAAVTYLCAALATDGQVTVTGVVPDHMRSVLSVLVSAGAAVTEYEKAVSIKRHGAFVLPVRTIKTMPYPGFPTDAQAIVMALMTIAQGSSMFIETIFNSRYKIVSELHRLGANISVEDRVALVEGVERLSGAAVSATDLRGGAALVVAGLAAEGQTVIDNVCHIERGYENMPGIMQSLGADMRRVVG